MTDPTIRKPLGILAILVWIVLWSGLALSLSDSIVGWPWFAQLAFFAIVGVIWIAPLRPVLRWMEVGRSGV